MADAEDDEDSPFAIPQYKDVAGRSLDFSSPADSVLFENVSGNGTAARPARVDQAQIRGDWPAQNVPAPKNAVDLSVLDIPELELPQVDLIDLQSSTALFDVTLGNLTNLDQREQPQYEGIGNPPLEDDFWILPDTLKPLQNDVRLLTWETFYNPDHKDGTPRLVSEAGSDVFDAVLGSQISKDGQRLPDIKTVKTNPLLRCLFELGVGRPSILFHFDESTSSFRVSLEELRASGYSFDSSQAVIRRFLAAGNVIKALRNITILTVAGKESDTCWSSVISAIGFVLDACEYHIVRNLPPQPTLLSLKTAFDRQHSLIFRLHNTIQSALLRTSTEPILYSFITQLEAESFGEDRLFLFFRALLKYIAEPWLSSIAEDIGISHDLTASRAVNEKEEQADLTLSSIEPPAPTEEPSQLLSVADREIIRMTKRNLTFLKTHHPEHPLCQSQIHAGYQPELSWEFDIESIDLVSAKARSLADRLQLAVSKFRDSSSSTNAVDWSAINDSVNNPADIQGEWIDELEVSIQTLNQAPTVKMFDEASSLTCWMLQYLEGNDTALESPVSFELPLLQSLRLSVRPFLELQHRLLSSECAKAILTRHAVREHLSLHHAFSLCSSGLFTSRLSATLFSQEASSAERKRGVLRSSGYGIGFGLRLGSGERQSWPPASSEVRLALMGILSETWLGIQPGLEQSATVSARYRGLNQAELPGGLSFSLRTSLSEAEIERVLDPNSIYALDFLKLSYTPPAALTDMFTDACLAKYDRIFRFLLKMIRMQYTIGQLHQDVIDISKRAIIDTQIDNKIVCAFKFQATHLVNTVASFVYNMGINVHWQNLIAVLDRVEFDLSHGELCYGDFTTLPAIHTQTLDAILSALLLRRRYRTAASTLEHIYGDILNFAWALRKRVNKSAALATVNKERDEVSIPVLFKAFGDKMAVFTQELRKIGSRTETQTEPYAKVDEIVRESHLSLATQLGEVKLYTI